MLTFKEYLLDDFKVRAKRKTLYSKKHEYTESQDNQCKIVSMSHLKNLEKKFDDKFTSFNLDFRFTRHFADRFSDSRNRPCISLKELEDLFNRTYLSKKMGRKIFSRWKDMEFVLKDISSDINIPFAVEYDENKNKFIVIAKTIMRKKDFKSSNNPIVRL